MRTVFASIIVLCFLPVFTAAQETFEKIYGGKGDQFGFGAALMTGGYVVCGHTTVPGPLITDAWILRLNTQGDTIWTRKAGGAGIDDTRSVIVTSDSAIVVCGSYSQTLPPKSDFFLMKTDLNGDTLWTRHCFSPLNAYGYSVAPAGDGFILCGYADSGRTTPRMMMARTDAEGNPLWTRLYGGAYGTVGYCAIATDEGGFIACGYIDLPEPSWNRDLYLVRVNGDGDTLWTRRYPASGYDIAFCISQADNRRFVLTGYTNSGGPTGADLYGALLSSDGEIIWGQAFGHTGIDIGYSGIQTADGGFIFCGQGNEQGNEFQGVYLIRTDASGDTLWTRMAGGFPRNTGQCIRQDSDGGFIIAGATTSASADELYDVLIMKTDEDGTLTSILPSPLPKQEISIYSNPEGNLITIGSPDPVSEIQIFDIQGNILAIYHSDPAFGSPVTLALPPGTHSLVLVRIKTLQNYHIRKVLIP